MIKRHLRAWNGSGGSNPVSFELFSCVEGTDSAADGVFCAKSIFHEGSYYSYEYQLHYKVGASTSI